MLTGDFQTARQGCTVIVPFREEMAKRHLKVAGDLGRVIFIVYIPLTFAMETGLTYGGVRNTIFETQSHWRRAYDTQMLSTTLSDAIILPSMSLIGCRRRQLITFVHQMAKNCYRNFDLEDVNVEGAERIADAVAKYDVDRFIHVSSHSADLNSPSEFYRTKVLCAFRTCSRIRQLEYLC